MMESVLRTRLVFSVLDDLHFRNWKARYLLFAVTFAAVFLYGVLSDLVLGEGRPAVALGCTFIAVLVLVIGPVFYAIHVSSPRRFFKRAFVFRVIHRESVKE